MVNGIGTISKAVKIIEIVADGELVRSVRGAMDETFDVEGSGISSGRSN